MIPTDEITAKLTAKLEGTGLFEKVTTHSVVDLSEALETLRDSPDALAIIVAARDTWTHQMALEDENHPARAELRQEYEVLITARDLRHGDDEAGLATTLKDTLADLLLWSNLDHPDLLCLPLESEPMVIERDHQRGREAWKLLLEIRQQTFPASYGS